MPIMHPGHEALGLSTGLLCPVLLCASVRLQDQHDYWQHYRRIAQAGTTAGVR